MENPYEILGVDKDASTADVKKAYFNLIKQYTPEKHGEKFKEIRSAYEQLKDTKKRIETDMFIFSDPYREFVSERSGEAKRLFIEEPAEKREYEAKIDLSVVINTMLESFSDLGRTDFRDDFNKI